MNLCFLGGKESTNKCFDSENSNARFGNVMRHLFNEGNSWKKQKQTGKMKRKDLLFKMPLLYQNETRVSSVLK